LFTLDLGTNLVQTAAFQLAKIARREFSIDTVVRFGALDNAPHDVVLDPEAHHAYQQTYVHAMGKDGISDLTERYCQAFSTPCRRRPTPTTLWRPFTVKELGRLMTARPTDTVVRAHEMGIYRSYFDLIVSGRKTIEIRVNDSSRRKIKVGSLIRFRCQGDEVLTRVTAVNRYASFEEMFDHQDVASVNPTATRAEQLANIRQIYPPEREALGVVAIGIELVGPPRPV
jgi:ASC-1-like (ASCH) protein